MISKQLVLSRSLTVSLLLTVVLAAGLSAMAEPARAAAPGDNGKIAFVGYDPRNGNPDIYAVNPDGSESAQLTNGSAYDREPTWSPDGTQIAFSRDGDIYAMNADGSGAKKLTYTPGTDTDPAWSPDGAKIAFVNDYGIYVMNADGSGSTRLADGTNPDFSPDGTKMAFSRDGDIYTMNSDGSGSAKLADDGANPAFSPNGAKIAFQSDRNSPPCSSRCAAPRHDIYAVNADGSEETRLTDDSSGGMNPAWSPDGAKIAFNKSYGGSGDHYIYVMNPDGSAKTNLTDDQNPAVLEGSINDWGAAPTSSGPSNTAPEITAPRPNADLKTRDRAPRITATVRDAETDLAKSDITLSLDGRKVKNFAYDATTGQLSYTSEPLSPGTHTVKVAAKDTQSLSKTHAWSFTVTRR